MNKLPRMILAFKNLFHPLEKKNLITKMSEYNLRTYEHRGIEDDTDYHKNYLQA